ncbi:hypothetical protein Tco_0899557 [Tanacetum coccineum]
MACDVSWKSRLSTLNDENVLLKSQVDSVVKERENIKLEYQKLFNSIKATRTQHQKELDELIKHVNQKTYAYVDVRSQNQDLLMIISELKNKVIGCREEESDIIGNQSQGYRELDNVAKDEDPKCWPICCQITRRGNGLVEGTGANRGVKEVNGNVKGVNGGVGGAPDFSTIIAQQLQNLLPVILAQVGNQGNVGNQNGNVVNENVQENVRNIYGMVEAMEPKTMQKAVQISGALTNEAVRNGSIKKVEKRGHVGEPSKDKNCKDDNKRTGTGNAFATTAKPAQRLGVNPHNQVVAVNGGQSRGNQGNQARGKAFMLGAEEARQDPNIVTGIEPSDLGFSYEIEIASGQLVEIDKEIEFQIELTPGATPVAKYPYRLAPSELEELSGQLNEL